MNVYRFSHRLMLSLVVVFVTTASASMALASPGGAKGFGLMTGYREVASAVVNGSIFECQDHDEGSAYYYIYLTTKMVDDMWEYLDWGGTVTLEVTTQHTFTGSGELSYSENISITGPGLNGSPQSDEETVSSPGGSIIHRMVFTQPITANDMGGMYAGGYIEVFINATADGDLGALCGQHVGGQAMWQARGAVIRLVP